MALRISCHNVLVYTTHYSSLTWQVIPSCAVVSSFSALTAAYIFSQFSFWVQTLWSLDWPGCNDIGPVCTWGTCIFFLTESDSSAAWLTKLPWTCSHAFIRESHHHITEGDHKCMLSCACVSQCTLTLTGREKGLWPKRPSYIQL